MDVFSEMIEPLRGGLIVSCQAVPQDPTFGPNFMAAFARAAQSGGAAGIRANSPYDVRAIREAVDLPIVGIWKQPGADGLGHIITPGLEEAHQLKQAGAAIIAGDVADRPRPGGISAAQLIRFVQNDLGLPFMADCASLAEAQFAQSAGASLVASTRLPPRPDQGPDLAGIAEFVRRLEVPVVAEGHFWEPEDVRRAFQSGVFAVVIGSAITRPWLITARFVAASPSGKAAPAA